MPPWLTTKETLLQPLKAWCPIGEGERSDPERGREEGDYGDREASLTMAALGWKGGMTSGKSEQARVQKECV